jgi:hypothetical protein
MTDSPFHWFILVVGLIPIALAIARGGSWDAEPTLGLALALFAARQLFMYRIPRSRN